MNKLSYRLKNLIYRFRDAYRGFVYGHYRMVITNCHFEGGSDVATDPYIFVGYDKKLGIPVVRLNRCDVKRMPPGA